ncbi:glucose-1-phosphate adenylyltransferase [Desulfitobacterium metallireducens]|uniref:Glucose-1-phosphate adenylyltransferase n=1 Tax=Desulfitobacterium metallireducens DSM 15288 TaxID=871968 RepID=W0ED97_9FIRM|nr:glucose-1-phosphate adenylyltransferase [Desulfitobacterium metallireducens]AHF07056.1 glucose-1-phosphate adenylyltransferase [Desulfitobacterium metallireducens DSM 15288]
MAKQEYIVMLLAGGQGSRLGPLTRNIAKPAVSFCGKYRIIDFCLSNCAKSRITTIGVLTQYIPFLLNSYIGSGSAWDLDDPRGGVHILQPYQGGEGGWYKGTANAVYHNMTFIDLYNPEYVLILSGDHIYKMDYTQMIRFHKNTGSEITIATITVPSEEVSRFGILTTDEESRVTQFEEKPTHSESNLASMGVYVFNWSVLKQSLLKDVEDPQSENDFGKNIIPKALGEGTRIYAYPFQGYWRDVGTIESYYHANMECLEREDSVDLFDPKFKIFSNEDILPAQYIGPEAMVTDSFIGNGCTVLGKVNHSILAPGAFVGADAIIQDSIVLPNAKIHKGSEIRKAIIGEDAVLMPGCKIGVMSPLSPKQEGITVIEGNQVIDAETEFIAGSNIYRMK